MRRINDIFYSLQGEGHNTGRAAVFVRFAGCNLRCSFCDTEFDTYREMTDDEVVAEISRYEVRGTRYEDCKPLIVLTGGEPTLQVDEALVHQLHQHGYWVAMESNGTRPAPGNLDWLTVSPKFNGEAWHLLQDGKQPDEVKIVFDLETPRRLENLTLPYPNVQPPYLFLQPCDKGDTAANATIMSACIDYIKRHPRWRLSLQTHKLIGIE